MKDYALILFDLDDTLLEWQTRNFMPGVEAWFQAHPDQPVAIVSNQGGVGLRYWMEQDGFGNKDAYPTAQAIQVDLESLYERLGRRIRTYLSFVYQSKKTGNWGPIPPGSIGDLAWRKISRKPAAGMLIQAMGDMNVRPEQTLMVGNGDEDQEAAEKAGCAFMWAVDFFKGDTDV